MALSRAAASRRYLPCSQIDQAVQVKVLQLHTRDSASVKIKGNHCQINIYKIELNPSITEDTPQPTTIAQRTRSMLISDYV